MPALEPGHAGLRGKKLSGQVRGQEPLLEEVGLDLWKGSNDTDPVSRISDRQSCVVKLYGEQSGGK